MLDPRTLQQVAGVTALIFELAVLVVAGLFAGSWLDSQLGIAPVALVSLSLGGLVLGMIRLSHGLQRLPRKHESDDMDADD